MAWMNGRQRGGTRRWPLFGLLTVAALIGHDLLMATAVAAPPPDVTTAHQAPASPTYGEAAAAPYPHGDWSEHPEHCRIGQLAVARGGDAFGHVHQVLASVHDVMDVTSTPSSRVDAVSWQEPRWPPGTLRALLQVYRIQASPTRSTRLDHGMTRGPRRADRARHRVREEFPLPIITIAAVAAVLPITTIAPFFSPGNAAAQDATPAMAPTCETAASASSMAGMAGMAMGTPMAEGEYEMAGMSVEFDQVYIDMMIPHHASIIALAQASQDRLTDERLQGIADNIIGSQQAEIEELRGYREQWYGSPEPMSMDKGTMGMMTEMMPGMGDMASMQTLMDPAGLVAAFCTAEDPNLAFIALTIPHHEMAIMASEAALKQATHDEIREIAERVIADQQREIDELSAIRHELSGESTPAA